MRWLLGLMMLLSGVFLSVGCASSTGSDAGASMPFRVDGKMKVNGLSCPLCAHNVDASLSRVPGVAGVKTDLSTGWVHLQFEEGNAPEARALDDAIADAGFTVEQSLTGVVRRDPGVATGHEGHDMGANPGPMVSDPDDPIIKGYGVRVPVQPGESPKSMSRLGKQLDKLPGVDDVQVESGTATLWFTPDACLTENQVKNAVKLAGYTAGPLATISEPRS